MSEISYELRDLRQSRKCKICGSGEISIHRDALHHIWEITCRSCGITTSYPAEDPDSDIVEPGEMTMEEALNAYEDIGLMVEKVRQEARRIGEE